MGLLLLLLLLARAAMVLAGRVGTAAAISVHHLVVVSILTEAATLALRHIIGRHFTAPLVLLTSSDHPAINSRLSFLLQFLLLPLQLLSQSLAFRKPPVQRLDHNRRTNFNPTSLGLLLPQIALHKSLHGRRIRVKVCGQF